MAAMDNEGEIPLFRAGGQTGGRPGPLSLQDHQRRLGHAGQGQAFGHQGEAAAGGSGHGPHPGIGGAQRHVDGADLILGLLHDDIELSGFAGEIDHHAG